MAVTSNKVTNLALDVEICNLLLVKQRFPVQMSQEGPYRETNQGLSNIREYRLLARTTVEVLGIESVSLKLIAILMKHYFT